MEPVSVAAECHQGSCKQMIRWLRGFVLVGPLGFHWFANKSGWVQLMSAIGLTTVKAANRMVRTRVHDLAAELGTSGEAMMSLLKDMGIFVRSHMSPLEDTQVAAIRDRWERERRRQVSLTNLDSQRRQPARIASGENQIAQQASEVRRDLTIEEARKKALKRLSPILRSALDLLEHGLWHFTQSEMTLDMKLCLLHIDQALELMLKERVLRGGQSIYKNPKETISIQAAYQLLNDAGVMIPERPQLELLHEERNQIQHKYSNPTHDDASFHIRNAVAFMQRFAKDELALELNAFISDELLSLHRP